MKKIVALVLSLVMALSLCTVAFGATEVYGLKGANNNVDKNDKYTGSVEFVKAKTLPDGDGYVAYYEYTEKDADGNVTFTNYLIPCEQADADFAIYKNDKFVAWVASSFGLDESGYASAAYYTEKVKVQKATTADPNCTTDKFFEDGYVDLDGCCFFVDAENGDPVNLDGKIIFVAEKTYDTDYVIWASHIFAKGVANEKTGYDVCTCLICKGEFAATNNEAVATKNGYKVSTGFTYSDAAAADVYYENAYDNGYDFAWGQEYADSYEFVWQLKAGTTDEIGTADKTETTTGVESAKTFDAGIAMYVGMSLMSVAGTAVVIGKKKEF